MTVTVKWGWIIQDQASVVHGMSFGPDWLKGQRRTGPVHGGYHNLIGKDIVFHGKGKCALGAIVDQMNKMAATKVRSGIREGMMIEKFEESEFGGGMDEVRAVATTADIVRMPYYVYVFPDEGSAYSFSSLVVSFTSQAVGFVPSHASVAGIDFRSLFEAGATAWQKGSTLKPDHRSDLQKALKAEKVFVVLTSKQRHGLPLATHSHTHSMPTLAKDIAQAVKAGR
jgi:hypothetical protein